MAKKFVDQVYLTNIKKHEEFAAKINGRHFIVAGPNGAGKTTVFQAMRRLLASLPDAEKPDEWINKNAENATNRLVLVSNGDTYTVEEKYSKSSGARSRIKLFKDAAGGKKDELKPAQERIKEIFGRVSDLTPLMDMRGQEQFSELQKSFNIDVSGYKVQRQKIYDERTLVNRDASQLEASLKSPDVLVTEEEKKTYTEEQKAGALYAEKKNIIEITTRLDIGKKIQQRRKAMVEDIKDIEQQIANLQKKKQEAEKTLSEIRPVNVEAIEKEQEAAVKHNEQIDEKIKLLSDHNVKVFKVRQFVQKEKELQQRKEKSKELTASITTLDQELNKSLAAIPFNEIYPTLELRYKLKTEEQEEQIGLYLDDLPFNRATQSYGEIIKCLIKLSIYLNPEGLNFCYIGSWNDLDTRNKEDLLKFASEHENVQLGIEKVDDTTQIITEFIDV